jgi:hypothetical protein
MHYIIQHFPYLGIFGLVTPAGVISPRLAATTHASKVVSSSNTSRMAHLILRLHPGMASVHDIVHLVQEQIGALCDGLNP